MKEIALANCVSIRTTFLHLPVQHVEFFDRHHFEFRYHRQWAGLPLSLFIDFFWETDFEDLYEQYPDGFSDALFPNVGYTYLINLGTPFVMQLHDQCFEMKSDGFLPRYKSLVCHHSVGNKIFGIKFKISPIMLEKRINFSEYKGYIFPLAYLIDSAVVEKIKAARSFQKRVQIASSYYEKIIQQYAGSLKQVNVVSQILHDCAAKNNFQASIADLSLEYKISSRTLQRYFEATTSINSKQALQIIRIRKAIEHLSQAPSSFHYSQYGYYDHSHFYKHLCSFLNQHTIDLVQPHLQLTGAVRRVS